MEIIRELKNNQTFNRQDMRFREKNTVRECYVLRGVVVRENSLCKYYKGKKNPLGCPQFMGAWVKKCFCY